MFGLPAESVFGLLRNRCSTCRGISVRLGAEYAIKEKGFFGNQNSVARPTALKWDYTVQRLKKHFGVS